VREPIGFLVIHQHLGYARVVGLTRSTVQARIVETKEGRCHQHRAQDPHPLDRRAHPAQLGVGFMAGVGRQTGWLSRGSL
jgi:hypothetical protein